MQPTSAGEPSTSTRNSSFSILGRIGGDATWHRISGPFKEMRFQYPRSDRRRCNLPALDLAKRPHPPFSILGRIGGDATPYPPGGGGWRLRLSVSSVGSEAMQRFQPRRWIHPHPLSVSSVGSEAMQRKEWLKSGEPTRNFQYPRSDRRRCNGRCSAVHPDGGSGFQYPRSDRRRCNWVEERGKCSLDRILSVSSVGSEAMQQIGKRPQGRSNLTFSILGRIGGDATSLAHGWELATVSFSILGRIGGDATQDQPPEHN